MTVLIVMIYIGLCSNNIINGERNVHWVKMQKANF